jgi:hypothetical protein
MANGRWRTANLAWRCFFLDSSSDFDLFHLGLPSETLNPDFRPVLAISRPEFLANNCGLSQSTGD